MNLFGNVERRAELTFARICNQFGFSDCAETRLEIQDCKQNISRHLNYHVKRQFFSRIYKLDVHFSIPLTGVPEGRAEWRKGRVWQSPDSALVDWLNQNSELNEQLSNLDTEKVYLTCAGANVSLHVRPIPGCFVWTLLPPIHYFVRIKDEEVSLISRLPTLLANWVTAPTS